MPSNKTSFGGRARLLNPLVVAAACTALALSACSSSHSTATASAGGFRGAQLSTPVSLTAADAADTFTSSAGGTTTLGALQQGHLMLLYFGYTHCPDVCPTTMVDLGQALRTLPRQVQAHTQVVFVTSDPARDSAAVMKVWLANFDNGLLTPFVGLTASIKQIDTVATSVGVPLSPPEKQADGTISVEHGAQTLAFVAGKASVVWLAGTSPGDYEHDIAALAQETS